MFLFHVSAETRLDGTKEEEGLSQCSFEIASKEVVVNPKAVLALGNTIEGWYQRLDWKRELFSSRLKLVASEFNHAPLVQRMKYVQRRVRERTRGRRWTDPMRNSQKIYVPILDGELENQTVNLLIFHAF